MTHDTPKETWIGALELAPKIAERLGIYLAQMTSFELALNKYFGILAGLSTPDIAETVFGRIINISTRLEIVEALAELPRNAAWQPRLNELIKMAWDINKCRNEYVHGAYRVQMPEQAVTLLTWATSKGRKSAAYVLDEKAIDADILQIRSFLGDTMSLFHPDLELPNSGLPT